MPKPELADALYKDWNTSRHNSQAFNQSLNKSSVLLPRENKNNSSSKIKEEVDNFRKKYTRGRYNQLEKRWNSSFQTKVKYDKNINNLRGRNMKDEEPGNTAERESFANITGRTSNRVPYLPISNYDLMWDQRDMTRINSQYRSIRTDYLKYHTPHYCCQLYEQILN